jgi:small subunit ribosomal protein S15
MARIYAHKKGASGSKRPYRVSTPGWVKTNKKEAESVILKLNKEGLSTAQIGTVLRDQYGVPSVKLISQKSVSQILKDKGVKFELPEDLFNLMKRAVKLRKHLETHKKDLHSKKGLKEVEMKIWRLLKYYRRTGVLPKDWKYTPETAALIVSGG